MNNLLIIETASAQPFIFLKKGELQEIILLENGPKLSQTIHTQLSLILSKLSIELKDLEGIAVGTGPGSFTGLRVGAALAKTLSFTLDIPLLSFYSHEAFFPKDQNTFTIIFDARSQGVYSYDAKTSDLKKIPLDITLEPLKTLPYICSPDLNLIEKLQEFSTKIFPCYPNIPLLLPKLENDFLNKKYNNLSLVYS